MRTAPLNFFKQKNNVQHQLIDLAVVEVSYVYMSNIESGSTKTSIIIDPALVTTINATDYDLTESDDGYCWVLTFEAGQNVGAMRKIAGYNPSTGAITFSVPLDNDPSESTDRVRISRNFFLANRNTPVDFYLPDESFGADVAMKYLPFPMAITPIGTNSKGEVMTLDVSLSAVDDTISSVIQLANGIQGNRVCHLRVFDSVLDQGKEYCIKDVAYVDSVTIDKQEVKLILESKYNIVGIQLPQCSYTRDFCRFMFKSDECSWSESDQGFYERLDPNDDRLYDYPLVTADSCDHTLNGPNGCCAHNNRIRFGGFPTLTGS